MATPNDLKIGLILLPPRVRIDWPASLPDGYLGQGFGLTPEKNAIAFPVDEGPPMRRPRFTKAVTAVQAAMLMTEAQWQTLKTFYLETLNGGGAAFYMPKPLGAANETWRVKFVQVPERRPKKADWIVSMKLRSD